MSSSDVEKFDREKEYWDSITKFEWLSERGIEAVLGVIPPVLGDVLELCSGSGMFPKRIPVHYDSYIGLDLSQSLLETLHQEVPSVEVVVGNAEDLPLFSSSFNFVLVFAGLHHMQNESKAIQNAYRVLKRSGQFVAFEPNANCWYRKPLLRLRKLINLYTQDERFLFPGDIKEKMEDAGFVDIEIKYLTPEYNPFHLRTSLNKFFSVLIKIASAVSRSSFWQSFFVIIGKK